MRQLGARSSGGAGDMYLTRPFSKVHDSNKSTTFNPESYDPRPASDLRLELHPDLRPNLLPRRLHPCHCRRLWPGHTLKHHNYGALERKVYNLENLHVYGFCEVVTALLNIYTSACLGW